MDHKAISFQFAHPRSLPCPARPHAAATRRCRSIRAEQLLEFCGVYKVGTPTRRNALQIALLSGLLACTPQDAQAIVKSSGDEKRGLGRYIKKKKLDPLESYVPPVIAARNQLKQAGSIMKDDLQSARDLLRSGPFDGLRDNIKALGEFAEQNGVKDSKRLVEDFFLKVQDFDFTLFQAKRYSRPVKEDSEAALQETLEALKRLLDTVPKDIVDDAERIVRAVEESSKTQPAAPKEGSDQQLDQLVQLVPG